MCSPSQMPSIKKTSTARRASDSSIHFEKNISLFREHFIHFPIPYLELTQPQQMTVVCFLQDSNLFPIFNTSRVNWQRVWDSSQPSEVHNIRKDKARMKAVQSMEWENYFFQITVEYRHRSLNFNLPSCCWWLNILNENRSRL